MFCATYYCFKDYNFGRLCPSIPWFDTLIAIIAPDGEMQGAAATMFSNFFGCDSEDSPSQCEHGVIYPIIVMVVILAAVHKFMLFYTCVSLY